MEILALFEITQPAYCTSWRDAHEGLVRYARAHDRNHSQSSDEGSMYAHNVPERVRTRQTVQDNNIICMDRIKWTRTICGLN